MLRYASVSRMGSRFSVREKLDGGGIVWKHHPRCTYDPPV
jgi:hypothetical protein